MAVLVYTEMSYLLAVRTGSQARAETDAAVYCIVAGDQGTTAQLNLTQPLSRQRPFRRAQAIHPLALLYAGRIKHRSRVCLSVCVCVCVRDVFVIIGIVLICLKNIK